jgi:hypothetical protein
VNGLRPSFANRLEGGRKIDCNETDRAAAMYILTTNNSLFLSLYRLYANSMFHPLIDTPWVL